MTQPLRQTATTPNAIQALELVEHLQHYFVQKLEALSKNTFSSIEWLRENGKFGGGQRFVAPPESIFNRGSVNVSQIQYENNPDKKLASATALSTIIHPLNPNAPSIHMHISWTEMKDGKGYWRIMSDLNPSLPLDEDIKADFLNTLKNQSPNLFAEATQQGEKYFFIPALERHRGVAHYYLESFNSGNYDYDYNLARSLGEASIDFYIQLLESKHNLPFGEEELSKQLDYHTLYLFQVLTLDRGTTSGLMVHSENDVGTLGSIPSHIDVDLLKQWNFQVEPPQNSLVQDIISVFPRGGKCEVNDEVKKKLAQAVRSHYQKNPEALKLQASGNVIPPTVQNHQNK